MPLFFDKFCRLWDLGKTSPPPRGAATGNNYRCGHWRLSHIVSFVAEWSKQPGGGALGLSTYGLIYSWKIYKGTLSRNQIPRNVILSWSSFKQDCVLPWKFVRNSSENAAMLPSTLFESHSRSAIGLQQCSRVNNEKYGPCHGVDHMRMIPWLELESWKWYPVQMHIPVPKNMWTPPPPGSQQHILWASETD